MAFVRFVLPDLHEDSSLNEGLFRLAYALRDDPAVSDADRELLIDITAWFDKHLPAPTRFNRTNSKGHYRRAARGISWFRDTATDCITRMYELKRILGTYGHQIHLVRETRLGYVVYEDAFQVVAEPFSDTSTSAS